MSTLASFDLRRRRQSATRPYAFGRQAWRTAALVLGLALSFALVSASAAQEMPTGVAVLFGCGNTGQHINGDAGTMQTVYCMAGCTGSVWGTDVYTDDSGVCTAAQHAGVIAETGGFVTVTILQGQESYTGSERNDVTSSDWESWGRSFSVAPAEELLVLLDCNTTGQNIAGEVGTTQVGVCPPGCSGSLWGTDIYTDDSGVCIAAQHAGVIAEMGGFVAVTILEGEESYTGSERNDIASSDYEEWARSFSVAPVVDVDELIVPVFGCWHSAQEIAGEAGTVQTVLCPAGCTDSVWGTDIYTDDSGVCTAARHAGLLTEAGGVVDVTILEGQESYTGSERNGVTSSEYGSWGRSFSVTPFVGAEKD